MQPQNKKDGTISKPNVVSNAPPYTIASLIGASELGKLGIIFPNLAPGIYQNVKTSELNQVDCLKNDVLTENITLDSSNATQSIPQSIPQNDIILEIQEPIQLGSINYNYFSTTAHLSFIYIQLNV